MWKTVKRMELTVEILISIFLVATGIAIGITMSTPSTSKAHYILDKGGSYLKGDTIHINSGELSKEELEALITLSGFYLIRVN